MRVPGRIVSRMTRNVRLPCQQTLGIANRDSLSLAVNDIHGHSASELWTRFANW